MSKLDKSIDWGKTSLLTDSDEADAIGKDGNRYKITTDGPWPIGNVEKGEELAKLCKHEEAIVYYDAAIKADKIIADGEEDNESPMLQYYKAESLTALGRDEEAQQCVDRAEELEPNGPPQP
jgi:tetratricopeptide (TPR) repeat protein